MSYQDYKSTLCRTFAILRTDSTRCPICVILMLCTDMTICMDPQCFTFLLLKKNTTIKNLHHVLYQILIKLDVVYLSEQILDGRNLSTTLNFFDIILISHVHIAKINSFKFIFHFSARPKSDWCTGCENLKGFICPVDKDL